MKGIRLLTMTTVIYVIIFTALSCFTFVLFFYFLDRGIQEGVIETLDNRRTRILKQIQISGSVPVKLDFSLTDFRITSLHTTRHSQSASYGDTLILQTGEQENEWVPFKKMTSYVNMRHAWYKLEIIVPIVENEAIVSSLLQTSVYVFGLMVIIFIVTTVTLFESIWRPFYLTLQYLRDFEIGVQDHFSYKLSKVKEFNTLNTVILDLIERTRNTFNNQKQFIENASHELQTPLAINQYKLEQLADNPALTKDQSAIVQTLLNSTQRMIKLNRTLLLLAKIDNNQYPETECLNVSSLIYEILELFEDTRRSRQITVIKALSDHVTVTANRILTDLLISNLIKNAFVHNLKAGSVKIVLNEKQLQIINTSNSIPIPADQLFTRFYKQTERKDSWGLGLAIVKKICMLNGWTILYDAELKKHSFIVKF